MLISLFLISVLGQLQFHRPDIEGKQGFLQNTKRNGYFTEEHFVTTDDGYILRVFRVQSSGIQQRDKVVFWQHGLEDSADGGISNDEPRSTIYILARQGFDVWVGNTRGNIYSRNHTTLNPDQMKFWDFSFHDMALHDIPSVLKYVRKITGKKIHYIGHSQGTTQMFAALSLEVPGVEENLLSFHALAPVTYLEDNKPLQTIANIKELPLIFNVLGIHEIGPNFFTSGPGRILCAYVDNKCMQLLASLMDYDVTLDNEKKADVILSHFLAGTSVTNLLHFRQLVLTKDFVYPDGKTQYKLENVRGKVFLYVGTQDKLGQVHAAKRLNQNLPQADVWYKEYYLGHSTFLFGKDMSYFQDPSIHNEMAKHYHKKALKNADYSVGYFKQEVDHNTFTDKQYFQQKYLVNAKYFKPGNPIFFYCGNEGPVEMFYENSYFLNNNLAQEFGAIVIYLEHRYFGESWPFGNKEESFKKENLIHLTSGQALQDFVTFLKWAKKEFSQGKVIAFGGSYGGMLASWLRMKYPNIVDGAVAMSAPIYYFKNREDIDIKIFYKIATDDYRTSIIGDKCVDLIRTAFKKLENYTNYFNLNLAFKTCHTVSNQTGVQAISNWLNVAFTYMSMTNYPYETKFLKALPGNPTHKACEQLVNITEQSNDNTYFNAIRRAAEIYYNYEQLETCNEVYGDQSSDDDMSGWNILACSDMVMPMSTDGIQDMYPPDQFNYTAYNEYCQYYYGLTPQYNYTLDTYGGVNDNDMKGYSNIFFSNGKLDPWSGGSPIKNISETVQAVYMDGCAHHLDLRAPNPLDPQSVVQGRQMEIDFIKRILFN